jgi:hypothetical protein
MNPPKKVEESLYKTILLKNFKEDVKARLEETQE